MCLCGAEVLPSHTQDHLRCSAQVSRLNPQACCLLLEAGQPTSPASSTVGKSILAKPPQLPAKLSRQPPQAREQFKLPQTGCSGHSCVMKFPFLVALGHHGKSEMPNSCSPLGVGWDSPQAGMLPYLTGLRATTWACRCGNVPCLSRYRFISCLRKFSLSPKPGCLGPQTWTVSTSFKIQLQE